MPELIEEPPALATQTRAQPTSATNELMSGRTIGLILSAAILFTLLTLESRTFLSAYTMSILSRQIGLFTLIALAQAFCLIVGGMNLSVGSIGSLSAVALGICMQYPASTNPWVAVPIAILIGSAAGLINGLLIVWLKIDSFIVTLSMMFVFDGLATGISHGYPYSLPPWFTDVGQKNLLGVPYIFWIVAIVLTGIAYMFRNTVFGRRLLATGGNADAARLSGINTNKMIVWANLLSGLFAGLASVLACARNGNAAADTGADWLLTSFAVAIIGGTGLQGGSVSALGLLMGGTIFMLIKYGLVVVKIDDNYSKTFLGTLILLAIIVDRIREVAKGGKRA